MLGRNPGPGDIEEYTRQEAQRAEPLTPAAYLEAVFQQQQYVRCVASRWKEERLDLLLTLSAPYPPLPVEALYPRYDELDYSRDLFRAMTSYTQVFNVTGQPAISLRLFWNSQNLPIGVQLVAEIGRDDLLVEVASQLEALIPWAHRRPPASEVLDAPDSTTVVRTT